MPNALHGHALLLLRGWPSEPAEESEQWDETDWQEGQGQGQEQEQEQERKDGKAGKDGKGKTDDVSEDALEVLDECVLSLPHEMLYSV